MHAKTECSNCFIYVFKIKKQRKTQMAQINIQRQKKNGIASAKNCCIFLTKTNEDFNKVSVTIMFLILEFFFTNRMYIITLTVYTVMLTFYYCSTKYLTITVIRKMMKCQEMPSWQSDLAALNCYLLFQTLVEQLVIFILISLI